MKKIEKDKKRIINEDINDIKYLIKINKASKKYDVVAELEQELKRLNNLKKEGI